MFPSRFFFSIQKNIIIKLILIVLEEYAISPTLKSLDRQNEIINVGEVKVVVKNFKESRELLELKQIDIANFFHISNTTVSGWETGKDTIPIRRLIAYANKYNFSLDYLFGISKTNLSYYPIKLDLNILASNLKKLRLSNNYTQSQIAKKLNTHQASYSHYENGKYIIPTAFIYGLIKSYNFFSVDRLFNRVKKD